MELLVYKPGCSTWKWYLNLFWFCSFNLALILNKHHWYLCHNDVEFVILITLEIWFTDWKQWHTLKYFLFPKWYRIIAKKSYLICSAISSLIWGTFCKSFFHILIYLFFFRYIGKNLTLSLVIVLTNILILDFFNTGYVLDCFHHWEVATFSTQMHGKKWFLGTPKQILRWKLLPNRWHIGEVTPLLC